MRVEFLFNSTSRICLTPESVREKQLLQLFVEAAKNGLFIGPSLHGQPDTVMLQSVEEVKEKK